MRYSRHEFFKISSVAGRLSSFLPICLLVLAPISLHAQGLSAEEALKANNPLADSKAINLQNYYIPALYGDGDLRANTFLLRYAAPFAKGKVLVRVTVPINSVPSGYNGAIPKYSSGLGDINFFATYTFSKPGAKTLLGVGPQVVFPSGSNSFTGAGKWQLGAAFIAFNTASQVFQWGALITYQHSIAGQSNRPEASLLVMQPFAIFQLGKGAYLRSTALWNFNTESDAYNVPIGIGAGHVAKAGKLVFNIFLEPQFTIVHYGEGQPALQLFGGINCQF